MKSYVPDARHLELLSRANLHDRLAGTLGILPNHLIQLIRLTNYGLRNQIINDLRFDILVLLSYLGQTTTLYHTYWKIIPECCRPKKKKKSEKKRKRRTKTDTLEECKNPFHYLSLKWKMQPIQGTCNCTLRMGYNVKKRVLENKSDLESIQLLPHTKKTTQDKYFEDTSGLDHKHRPSNSNAQLDIRQFLCIRTSADIAREEQDRKKRFKLF